MQYITDTSRWKDEYDKETLIDTSNPKRTIPSYCTEIYDCRRPLPANHIEALFDLLWATSLIL